MTPPPYDVLVVDDQSELVSIYIDYFEAAGFKVRGVTDVHEAIHILKTTPPRLLLIDFQMQALNGLDVLETLPMTEGSRPITILATAFSNFEYERACDAGVSLILRKPFRINQLIMLTGATLGTKPSSIVRQSVRVSTLSVGQMGQQSFLIGDMGLGGLSLKHQGDALPPQGPSNIEIIDLSQRVPSLSVKIRCVWQGSDKIGYEFVDLDKKTKAEILRLISIAAQNT